MALWRREGGGGREGGLRLSSKLSLWLPPLEAKFANIILYLKIKDDCRVWLTVVSSREHDVVGPEVSMTFTGSPHQLYFTKETFITGFFQRGEYIEVKPGTNLPSYPTPPPPLPRVQASGLNEPWKMHQTSSTKSMCEWGEGVTNSQGCLFRPSGQFVYK